MKNTEKFENVLNLYATGFPVFKRKKAQQREILSTKPCFTTEKLKI